MSPDMTARPTILLVDDSDLFRSKVKELLKERGFGVVEAANGQEALEAAESVCPDLVVMDVSMPIMDGLAASKRMRQAGGQCQNVPILAISAGGPELREAALQAGCNDYFSKGEIHRLITVIEDYFREQ